MAGSDFAYMLKSVNVGIMGTIGHSYLIRKNSIKCILLQMDEEMQNMFL